MAQLLAAPEEPVDGLGVAAGVLVVEAAPVPLSDLVSVLLASFDVPSDDLASFDVLSDGLASFDVLSDLPSSFGLALF